MNLFNLSLNLNGFPIKKAKQFLEKIKIEKDENYNQYILDKKNSIVNYHLKHNSFYKSFAKNANVNEWHKIPIMSKKDLQQPLANRLSKGFTSKNIHVHKTSGSSGTPFIFAKDKFCHALTWAVFMDRYSWFNLNLNTSKQARFYGISLNKKTYYKERLKDSLSNRFRFSVFDLSDNQLKKNLILFKKKPFQYVNGYTSAILQFAKFLKEKNITLKNECPTLKACIVTSEMLFETDKKLLEASFGVAVINEYGAAELGLIAFQNKNDEWLLNNEDLYIEIIDENDAILPNGKEGRIVITSLYNKAHPFIRYDVGDIGTLSKSSNSKKPILQSLLGRSDDIIILPSGKKAAGLTFYYVTKTIIEDSGNVKEFIIEQLKVNTFTIKYTSNSPLSEIKISQIKEAIEKYLEPNLIIHFKRESKLDRAHRGKLKQFKSFL